jgi:hypothetical protein
MPNFGTKVAELITGNLFLVKIIRLGKMRILFKCIRKSFALLCNFYTLR